MKRCLIVAKQTKMTTLEINTDQLLKFNSVKTELQEMTGHRMKNPEAFEFLLDFFNDNRFLAQVKGVRER